MEENKTLLSLINPPFTFRFADKEFQARKANIRQIEQYQLRLEELSKDSAILPTVRDCRVLSYCVFLVLNRADASVTEEWVSDNLSGDIDGLELLCQLGFIDPQKVKLAKMIQEKSILQLSSLQSQEEQDGLQSK